MHAPSLVRKSVCFILLTGIFFFSFSKVSNGYSVTNIKAEYHNGQVFLTWTNPSVKSLQYNVYRSTSSFTSTSQLNSSSLLGFVRDSSSKNIFWSQQSSTKVFYKITDKGQPLVATQGLYVATCNANQSCYYAVTVTNLSNNIEELTIVSGVTCLSTAISETAVIPEPVYQDSLILSNGDIRKHYVQFVNNQETALYPAMNTYGSYGFDIYLVKRGSATSYPLFILFQGYGGEFDKGIGLDDVYTDCYALGVYDWLPIPTGGSVGDNAYFYGYHENFNIYSNSNPIPTTGIVKSYVQTRYMEAINWIERKYPIDTTRLYTKGTSANGFGAILMASIIPEKIAAVYDNVEPFAVSPLSDTYKQMWGESATELNSDILDWETGDALTFKKLTHFIKMMNVNEQRSMPPVFDIHGKNDVTVTWNADKVEWMDSLNLNHIGGAWYWDQRDHGGSGKNFDDEEMEPNYYRFATNISYPAFSNCSINQDPGNGNKKDGADYGTYNGYLDFVDDNIADKSCSYLIHVFIKDFYVGGVLDALQYSTCTTDVTFRRLQNFQPAIGSTIKWKNFDDVTNLLVQSGSFTYNGGLITLTGLTVTKTGNRFKLKIKDCTSKLGDDDSDADESMINESLVTFSKTPAGYMAHLESAIDQSIDVSVYDLLGRTISVKRINLLQGSNSFEITAPSTGIYFIEVNNESFHHTDKLMF